MASDDTVKVLSAKHDMQGVFKKYLLKKLLKIQKSSVQLIL